MSHSRFYCDIMAMHPEVTGSCMLVIVKLPTQETIRFVVDCGIFQEKEYEELNNNLPFNPDNIQFALVTHNHVDHIGRLPYMVKKGFRNKIYATATTAKLLPYSLVDSCKVLKDTAKRKNTKVLYDDIDVSQTLSLVKPCDYNEKIMVNENINVTFLKNGHLMGASMIFVQISYPGYEDINLLFTGDYNSHNMFFDVDPIPEEILNKPLTVIQESTYGTMDSEEIVKTFKNNLLEAIDENKTVIVPVFSLGRAQEILYEIKCMQDNEELSADVPIYFDGKLAIKYTNLYIKDGLDIKDEMKDFVPKNITYVDKTTRTQVLYDYEKKIVLTTSGMGSYGPAQTYIPEYISRKDALIHFTGYTAEDTFGGKLKNTEKGETVEIGGLIVKKRADVEYTTEYSAHAKADEMIDFLKQFNNLKLVLVNHGKTETKKSFSEKILNEVEPKYVGILGREYFFRVNPYGLQKTLSSKFK